VIDKYIHLESQILGQNTANVALTLLVVELVGAAILLAAGNSDWIYLVLGAAGVIAGMWLHKRSQLWGKTLIGAGGFPVVLALAGIFWPLAFLLMVVYAWQSSSHSSPTSSRGWTHLSLARVLPLRA
jgi:hypothetical protein